MRRVLPGLAVLLGVLILAPVVAFYTVDPNWLKPRIEAMASKALGRKLELRGPLEVRRGWALTVTAHDIHLANVPGAETSDMLAVNTVEATVDLWRLVTHWQLAFPEIAVSGADLHVARNAQGEGNWHLGAVQQLKPERRARIPLIGHATIRDAKVSFKDEKSGYRVAANLREAKSETAGLQDPVKLQVSGDVGGQELAVDGTFGPFAQLIQTSQPYPIDTTLRVGATTSRIKGTIAEPAQFLGVDLATDSQIYDATTLFKALGLRAPPLPNLKITAKLKQDGQIWRADELKAAVGKVEMAGSLALTTGGEHPKATGELHCETLRLVDVQELMAGAPKPKPREKEARLIPNGPIPEATPPMDLDIALHCG
jgi:AsmA family protein